MAMQLREVVSTNGGPMLDMVRVRKPKGKRGTQPSRGTALRAAAAVRAERWARWYTGTAVGLSSVLNGYAAVVESKASTLLCQGAAAGIGVSIPVLVWMLGTVTAWTYRAGWKRLALVSGCIAACVLALSVCHVAGALAALTGSSLMLSVLLAIGIDCGLVSSEATAIMVSSVE